MLYVIATPIGNLEDISQRALRVLRECDEILCEDTRHSSILLNHYAIRKPLISYHQFKEQESLERILHDLGAGKKIALISDAGTPCISDPGERLTAGCAERNIPFTIIPGACSAIQALVFSAFPADRFQWIGFLPKEPKKILRRALFYSGCTIAFESPARLLKTLEILKEMDPNRKAAVAREMTKTFEECRRGTAEELLVHFHQNRPKGEIVLIISPGTFSDEHLSIEECVQLLREQHGLSMRDAIKQAANLLKMQKRQVYKRIIHFEYNLQ